MSWGEAAYGEASWAESPGDISTGVGAAVVNITALGRIEGADDIVGEAAVRIIATADAVFDQPGVGLAGFSFDASGISEHAHTSTRVIHSTLTSNRGKTGLSHTGLN